VSYLQKSEEYMNAEVQALRDRKSYYESLGLTEAEARFVLTRSDPVANAMGNFTDKLKDALLADDANKIVP
jgi:hypothetical protein